MSNPAPTPPEARRGNRGTIRSATGVRVLIVAALAGTAAMGSYSYFGDITSIIAGGEDGGSPTTSPSAATASFTTADVGSCLTWDVDEAGEVIDFEQADCESEHRFEISAREDLGVYPSSEFGPDAPVPDLTRQAQLREELCQSQTLRYLDGRFDPSGRYSIAPILPPADYWEAGDRTMLCGLQAADTDGTPALTTGPVSSNDQSRVFAAGDCVRVETSSEFRVTDCASDHHLQTVSTVNLGSVFPNGTPSVDDQNGYLNDTCTSAAVDFLGSEEDLYQSTLQIFWTTLPGNSWVGGSQSVNCFLMSPADGEEGQSFNTLNGSATGDFTINGEAPPPQPERDPLREDAE